MTVNETLSRLMQCSAPVLAVMLKTCAERDPEVWASVEPLLASGAEIALEIAIQPVERVRAVVVVSEKRLVIGTIELRQVSAAGAHSAPN